MTPAEPTSPAAWRSWAPPLLLSPAATADKPPALSRGAHFRSCAATDPSVFPSPLGAAHLLAAHQPSAADRQVMVNLTWRTRNALTNSPSATPNKATSKRARVNLVFATPLCNSFGVARDPEEEELVLHKQLPQPLPSLHPNRPTNTGINNFLRPKATIGGGGAPF